MTATQMLERDQREREDVYFSRACEAFIRHWGPEDPRALSLFSAELMTLMQRGMLVGQEPLVKQLGAVAMATPMPLLEPVKR